jgi:putative transposase
LHIGGVFPGRPHHLRDFNYLGQIRYFLTFATGQRRNHFADGRAVALVLSYVLRAAKDCGFEIPVFCFMPDHVHLVVVGTSDTSDLLAFIRRAKQFSGYYFSKEFNQRLRQRDGYEHVLRDNEATAAVIKYVSFRVDVVLARGTHRLPSIFGQLGSIRRGESLVPQPG